MFKFSNLVYIPSLTNKICDAKVSLDRLVADVSGVEVPICFNRKEDKMVQAFKADILNYYYLVNAYPELEKPHNYDVIFSYETSKSVGENAFYRLLLIMTKVSAIVSRTYVDNGVASTVTKQIIIDVANIRKPGTKFETHDKKSSILCTEEGFMCLVEGLYFGILLTKDQDEVLKKLSVNLNKVLFKQSVLVPWSIRNEGMPDKEYTMVIYPNRITVKQVEHGKPVNSTQTLEFKIDFDEFVKKEQVYNGNSYVKHSAEGFSLKFNNDCVTIPVSVSSVEFLNSLVKDFWDKI